MLLLLLLLLLLILLPYIFDYLQVKFFCWLIIFNAALIILIYIELMSVRHYLVVLI